jgi:hypothetical protein
VVCLQALSLSVGDADLSPVLSLSARLRHLTLDLSGMDYSSTAQPATSAGLNRQQQRAHSLPNPDGGSSLDLMAWYGSVSSDPGIGCTPSLSAQLVETDSGLQAPHHVQLPQERSELHGKITSATGVVCIV